MKTIVGKVYANWCGHCQDLKPKWAILKQIIPKSRVEFVEFEETEEAQRTAFEQKHRLTINVSGYPTIFKITPNHKIEYYSGPREPANMKQWILSSSKHSKKPHTKKRFRRSRKTQKTRSSWNNLF
jgi:thiol-disulfide isomerase/thioredoxin